MSGAPCSRASVAVPPNVVALPNASFGSTRISARPSTVLPETPASE
ncbi:hypothetical protein [Streptomyces venezuelae]